MGQWMLVFMIILTFQNYLAFANKCMNYFDKLKINEFQEMIELLKGKIKTAEENLDCQLLSLGLYPEAKQ